MALLVGAAAGILVGYKGEKMSVFTVTTTTITAVSSLKLACTYLASQYQSPMKLIFASPNDGRYFLYSDNFLAARALSADCGNSDHFQNINESINSVLNQYNPSKIPNQYMALECRGPYFNASKDYDLSNFTWTTINNQTGTLNDSYADIAFLGVYFDDVCNHNSSEALSLFNVTAQMYKNNTGFIDAAYLDPTSPSYHQYQTYKLALYIFTAGILNQTVPLSAIRNLIRMQAGGFDTGGFYTGYDASFSNDGTSTNTETTSLAIMALTSIYMKLPTTTATFRPFP